MDAQKFGTFIAVCRKEKNMTQADLAAEPQVTDKAVSRWERGIGFPDTNTLEPLADALDVSVLELMRSERITEQRYSNEASAEAVSDTLKLARQQQRHERKKIFPGASKMGSGCVFMEWRGGLTVWPSPPLYHPTGFEAGRKNLPPGKQIN